jgi:hypothetical protein
LATFSPSEFRLRSAEVSSNDEDADGDVQVQMPTHNQAKSFRDSFINFSNPY